MSFISKFNNQKYFSKILENDSEMLMCLFSIHKNFFPYGEKRRRKTFISKKKKKKKERLFLLKDLKFKETKRSSYYK